MIYVTLIFVFTALISWILVNKLTIILQNKKIVDVPNDRSMHEGEIPRGGGLVIIALLLVSLIVLGLISGRLALFLAIFITVLAWALLGWVDDRVDLSPHCRMLLQIVFTCLMLMAFGWVNTIHFSEQNIQLMPVFGILLSVIGVLWLANLYNFMDGIDGLAASQTVVAGATLCFWLWQYGDQTLALVCLVLAAASYGFLLCNWHPAKIFMGDVGSVTIGAFFATIILIGVGRYEIPVISFVILFGVFVADASITIIRRCLKREKIWLPHRSHYYQRLAALDFDHGKIVLAALVLMTLSSLIATITVIDRDTIVLGALVEMLLLASSAIYVEALELRRHRKI